MRHLVVMAIAVAAVALFAPAAQAGQYYRDPVSDSCFGVSIDKNSPCYSTTGYPGCTKPTDYDSCVKYCDCGYEYNKKKCDGGALCLEIATSERNACLGGCITDWT